MLEARNTTVAPPGRRSMRLTGGAADADTSVLPAAEPNTARRKRQDDNEGDHSHSVTTQKSQANAEDNDHSTIRKRVDEHSGTARKHQDDAEDDDHIKIRKQIDEHSRTAWKCQDNAEDDNHLTIHKQVDKHSETARKHQDDAHDEQRGPCKRQDVNDLQDTTPFCGRQWERSYSGFKGIHIFSVSCFL